MNDLRQSHAIWLMRRAAMLDGTAADAAGEATDSARSKMLYQLAARVTDAVERHSELGLGPAERTLLITEAQDLTDRAAAAVRQRGVVEMERGEEWLRIARSFREILEAARGDG